MWYGERKNQAPRKQDALGTSATLPMTPRAHQACVSPSSYHLVLPDPDLFLGLEDFEDQLIPLADQLLPLPAICLPYLPFFSV